MIQTAEEYTKIVNEWLPCQEVLESAGFQRTLIGDSIKARRVVDVNIEGRRLPDLITMTWYGSHWKFRAYDNGHILAMGHEFSHLKHVAENGVIA